MFDDSVATYLIILLTLIALQLLFCILLGATLVYVHRIQLEHALERGAEVQKQQYEAMFGPMDDDELDNDPFVKDNPHLNLT